MEDRGSRFTLRIFCSILHPLSSILILVLASSGCAAVGVIASKTIPQNQRPQYVGLQKQTIGVMVWADRAVRIDWDSIQLDAANEIQSALKKSKAKELEGATFPVQPASIVRYQRDNPYLETAPITDFAPELGVSRLIYVEIEQFSTRSQFTYQMYRGTAIVTLKVIEIHNGAARVAYEENGVVAGFPRKGPAEGEIVGNDAAFYGGTLNVLAEEIVKRLTTHEVQN